MGYLVGGKSEGRVNSTFILFCVVVLLLALVEAIYDFVVANSVYSATASAQAVAFTLLIAYVSEIFISLFLGGFADGHKRLKTFCGVQVLLLLACVATLLLISSDSFNIILLWCLTFLFDGLNHLSRLFIFSIIPYLFDSRRISQANGVLAIGSGLSRSLGPLTVAIFGFGDGSNSLLILVAGTILASMALTLVLAAMREEQDTKTKEASGRVELREALLGSFRATRTILGSDHWRGFALSYSSLLTLIVVSPLLWIPTFSQLQGFTVDQIATAFSSYMLGSVLGGVVVFFSVAAMADHRFLLPAIYLGVAVGLILTVFYYGGPILVYLGALIFGFASSIYYRLASAEFQRVVPTEVMGSWNAAIDTLSRIMGMACVVCLGTLIDLLGSQPAYLVLTVICVLGLKFGKWKTLPPAPIRIEGACDATHHPTKPVD